MNNLVSLLHQNLSLLLYLSRMLVAFTPQLVIENYLQPIRALGVVMLVLTEVFHSLHLSRMLVAFTLRIVHNNLLQ